jgi:tetratricopeptide (TPR) repeat protein
MRLHGAAAELLRLAGWASFEAGHHGAAQRFWIAALHGAHSAGDRALGANILGSMSNQAKDLGLFGEAVHLAEAAKRGYPGGSPRVSAILDLRAAEAYAQAGESKRCLAAIDAGYGSLRDMNDDDAGGPAWSYWMDEAHINAQAGYCYTRLGDWPRAQDHLTTAIRLQDDSYRREGALRCALLALTYTHQGEPEQACGVANEAVDVLADDVDSDRCIGHIRRVRNALAPYRTVAAVRDFHDRTRQLLKG